MVKVQLAPREQILDYLLSFDFFEKKRRSDEGISYVTFHIDRLLKTIELIPQIVGTVRVLELGAIPFFMTILIKKHLGYNITPANFFGDYGEIPEAEDRVTISSVRFKESYTFQYRMFNVERDAFPYEDGEFDIVLCCEILEHLIMDPSHLLKQAHRVLKKGGYLMISTPNAVKLERVINLTRGKNIFEQYSGYGVYGRHNREYTASELSEFLKIHNFEPTVILENIYPHSQISRLLTNLGPLKNYRDNLFAIGRAVGTDVKCYPEWLYMHQWGRLNVISNTIMMGDGEVFQLGPGWHDFENWPPGIRWTGRKAVALLKPEGKESTFCFLCYAGPNNPRGQIRVNGVQVGTFALGSGTSSEIVLPLPDSIRSSIDNGKVAQLEICFTVENPFIPSQSIVSSKDNRELGIAVERLWLA